MLKLSRSGIRNIACDDAAYARGLHYYKKNRVSNAAFSKAYNQYKIQVMGSYQYQVLITEQNDGSFSHSCNCPSHVKYSGACKHVVAALLFLLKYQEKSLMEAPQTTEEKRACQVLDYFGNQEDTFTHGEVYHIEAVISIPVVIRDNNDHAVLNLYAGSKRMYKIQGVKKFLQDVSDKTNIFLGKEFSFRHGESEFDKSSMQLLDFLLDIAEINNVTDSYPNYQLFYKANVLLSKRLLIKLFKTLGKSRFKLLLYGKKYEEVGFQAGNPYIHYDLDVFEDAVVFNDFYREAAIPLTENGELIYYDKSIYQPDKRFIRNFLPFYNIFKNDYASLVFRDANMNKFLEEVLPKLHDTMDIAIPDSLKSRYLSFDMKPAIYFDKHYNDIKAELKFNYGDYSFNCFEEPKAGPYILIRKKEDEYKIMHMMEELDFEPLSMFYLLKNDKSIYDFLNDKINVLAEHCDLYYSDDFRQLSIHSEGRFKVGIKLGSDIDFLELDVEFENIPRAELSELFRSYRLKKKYYRLRNGSFINLSSKAVHDMAEIFDNLNYKSAGLNEDSIKLKKSSIFYLQDALNNDAFIVNKDEGFKIYMDRILTPSENEYILPADIKAKLHQYQVTGYRWLSTLADYNLGGILADDMGLGKTLQAIVYIASRIDNDRKFLIVCPSSLIYNWLDEFENFAPHIWVRTANGTPSERKAVIENRQEYQVIITSYPLIRRDLQHLQRIHFDTVFIDEAQFIKNASSLSAHSVKALDTEHRFAMTGTPIENSLSELWSIFDYIMPNYLMNHSRFIEHFEKKITADDERALESLNKRIQPFILRRLKKDVLLELPDKTEEKILTDMTDEQKKIYMSYIQNIRSEFLNATGEFDYQSQRLKFLSAVMRLRQICCHPATFLNGYEGGSGKLELLLQLLNEGIAGGHRILVFSQFTSMLKIIEEELIKDNISYFYLEGATPIQDRNEYVKGFNDGNRSVFLISLKAGGTGLNLTGADMVIHYDPWWNPAVEEQAADRAYRIGQEKNVHVIKLIAKGTIEEKIYKLQRKKKELSDSVIQSKEVFINLMSKEEIEDLLR